MESLRFYFASWNVATKSPTQDLNSLLNYPSVYNKNRPSPDFYIIGLQEVKSSPHNVILDSLFNDAWSSALSRILCTCDYVKVKAERLQGILLLVYARQTHLIHLRSIESTYTKTGLGGMWGNKGAVSVRFDIYGCSFAIVNSHLAAHEHLLHERIEDYNTIVRSHSYNVEPTSNIMFHDYVFWIGDLNFRLGLGGEDGLTPELIAEMVARAEKDDYSGLLKHDQLRRVQGNGDAFSELKEHSILFAPTYKFEFGTDVYDSKRKPSWTDRILYKVIPNNYENVTLKADVLSYNSLPHYTLSDHKPVMAEFKVKVLRKLGTKVTAKALRGAMFAARSLVTYDGDVEEAQEADQEDVFANYTEKTVTFEHISKSWTIGDADFTTVCTLSSDIVVNPNDWIGVYDANFQSLDDYIAYEYLAKVSTVHERLPDSSTSFIIHFPVGVGVRKPGLYRLMYFSQPHDKVKSVLGISEPFEVCPGENQPGSSENTLHRRVTRNEHTDTNSQQSESSSRNTSDSIFSDFATLDVASLSSRFSSDLSID